MTRKPDVLYNYNKYLSELKFRLQHANKIAAENLRLSKIRSKEFYHRTAKQTLYNVGDFILINGPVKVTSTFTIENIYA